MRTLPSGTRMDYNKFGYAWCLYFVIDCMKTVTERHMWWSRVLSCISRQGLNKMMSFQNRHRLSTSIWWFIVVIDVKPNWEWEWCGIWHARQANLATHFECLPITDQWEMTWFLDLLSLILFLVQWKLQNWLIYFFQPRYANKWATVFGTIILSISKQN
jgi:hypothetical protein